MKKTQAIMPGDNFAVFYGRFVEDKEDGIYLDGIYFGGVGRDNNDAEKLAKECVQTIRGGVVIPKIFPIKSEMRLIDLTADAQNKFYKLEKDMIDVEDQMAKS